MFTSFNEKNFWNTIERIERKEETDFTSLKINTVSSMRNDPTFARGETDAILKILEDRVPEIFEEEVRLDYEERLEPDSWDKRYFTSLTQWFIDNFAESRIDHIKEVGRAVHQDTARTYNESLAIGSQQEERSANPTQAPTAKRRKLSLQEVITAIPPLVKVIGAVVVLLLVIKLAIVPLIKLLSK